VPGKGRVLNELSAWWFARTAGMQPNHMVHKDVGLLDGIVEPQHRERLAGRIMVCRKAQRIDIECVVRGYITGGGWRQYVSGGAVNGIALPDGLRKNGRLDAPI